MSKSAAGGIAWCGPVEFEEGFLGKVLGVGSVVRGAVEEVDESRLPAFDQAGECTAVAFGERA